MPTLSLPHMQDVTRLYIAFHKTKGKIACFILKWRTNVLELV